MGYKPTIEGQNPLGVETHLFDFHGDLYGRKITVEFLERLRDEQKFDSLALLKSQLQRDVAAGRQYFRKQH